MSRQFVNNKDLIDKWKTGLEQRDSQCLDKVLYSIHVCVIYVSVVCCV